MVLVSTIQSAVCQHYGISLTDLLSERQGVRIARPRQVGMYLAKKLSSRSLPDIGRRFGGRDHSTVVHAVKRIDQLRQDDQRLNNDIVQLGAALARQIPVEEDALATTLTGWMA